MVKKKNVVGRRMLSILLCMLMVVCAIPMVAFAFTPADGAGIVVVQKNPEDAFLVRTTGLKLEGSVYAGTRLGDTPINIANSLLRFPKEDGTNWDSKRTYTRTTGLAARWENPETIIETEGPTTQLMRFYLTADESVFIVIEYTFEVLPAKSAPTPEINVKPTIDSPVKYREGLKVSDLNLNTEGAQATVAGEVIEGTFAFTNPNQVITGAGNWGTIEVTFTPADLTQAEPVTFTVSVTVEKGDIQVLQKPVITIDYGTKLKNVSLSDFRELETIPASGVTWDWMGAGGSASSLSDPRADQVLAVGTYDDILVRAMTMYNASYAVTFIPVTVVVNPVSAAFPMDCKIDAAARQITVTGRGNLDATGSVTYTLHSDSLAQDLVIAGKGVQDVVTFELDANAKSGAYTVTATYTAGANDPCNYAAATKQLDARFNNTVTVTGGKGSGDYKAGDTVYIMLDMESIKKNYQFKSWKITNANGDTIDVGVEDLTKSDISFVMPDEAIKVEAQTSFSIQLFFENLGNSIMSFFMKIAEWFQGLFNGMGTLS